MFRSFRNSPTAKEPLEEYHKNLKTLFEKPEDGRFFDHLIGNLNVIDNKAGALLRFEGLVLVILTISFCSLNFLKFYVLFLSISSMFFLLWIIWIFWPPASELDQIDKVTISLLKHRNSRTRIFAWARVFVGWSLVAFLFAVLPQETLQVFSRLPFFENPFGCH